MSVAGLPSMANSVKFRHVDTLRCKSDRARRCSRFLVLFFEIGGVLIAHVKNSVATNARDASAAACSSESPTNSKRRLSF
jgi:hypothetical protein